MSPSAESPYAVVNKLKKKSEPDMDLSACSHHGFLFKRERFQWHKVGKWEGEGGRQGGNGRGREWEGG